MPHNTRAVGAEKEQLVAACLKRQGYEILERNFRCRLGEIDIIARETVDAAAYLVFIEVKYRQNGRTGSGFEAVDLRKQRRISRVAAYYCMRRGLPSDTPVRFDVAAVTGDRIELVRNAFEYAVS